jgi:single-stranded-DNA-specific exonuclease
MLGMEQATRRLLAAVAAGERIAIYGDYDVDGLAGAALVTAALERLGADLLVHIPHRSRDGYGLNLGAVESLAAQGTRVLVTVDCGITGAAEVAGAAALGIDTIVTDHHPVPTAMPAAVAVLNPHQAECPYPFKDLSGGGVAYQLARSLLEAALGAADASTELSRLAGFAALSTVADVVPLVGENRVLVARGLAAARAGAIPGIEALCRRAGRSLQRLTGQDLAFSVIPRLNAAGRMGDAREALDLLVTLNPAQADDLAGRLDVVNRARRLATEEVLAAVEEEAMEASTEGVIVLAGDYAIGLAGIVAARIVDRYGLPCAVVERGSVQSRGSLRGPEGVDLAAALETCASLLDRFGGHPRAAGFTLPTSAIDRFRDAFRAAVLAQAGRLPDPVRLADAPIMLSSVGWRLADLVERFEPTGAGNPNPTFVSRGVLVRRVEGADGGRLRLSMAQGGAVRNGRAFRREFEAPAAGDRVDVLYEVERTVWEDQARLDLVVRDIRESSL